MRESPTKGESLTRQPGSQVFRITSRERARLVVDEALATGDSRFRRRSEQRVRELLTGAGTVFLVSHAVNTIQEVCDRSIWLERGLIRMDGPTEEVVAAYEEFMAR